MALLTLQFKDLALKEFELTGQSMTMGREPDNDIIVENLLVSGYHARIDPAGREYILTDLQSKNGTFVNGERVTSTKLKDGDQILVGKHTIVFTLSQEEIQEDQKLTEPTMFIEVAQGASEPESQDPTPAGLDSTAVSAERRAVLSFLVGGGDEYEIKKKLVKLGKGTEADVHIGGLFTPKVAATISRRPTGYHLTPTGRAKVKVNDAQVGGSHRLREFDTIEIGPATLQFYYKG
ncbi:MAG: FHA domain-containing protein [Deltaproteobacteria bacterium]|jgi:pSer/pThr/pTyr-binding forkhead associated (FHA) protein|nr:FHA domain-containing protein [Deltaproteobacteria bacterium]